MALFKEIITLCVVLSFLAWSTNGHTPFPLDPKPFQTITSSHRPDAGVRYRELDASFCETTPGVKSYAGYIDVAQDKHVFFWLFESRRDPKNDDITIFVDGGPGVDPAVALLQEIGPCILDSSSGLKSRGDTSWNEVSNLLFLALPYGVGFSYQIKEVGYKDTTTFTATFLNSSYHKPNGRWALADYAASDTSLATGAAAYEALQVFLSDVQRLDKNLSPELNINLWSRSYGGKYGPVFFRYFAEQNQKVMKGEQDGIYMSLNTLGIADGITDEYIQAPFYPKFAYYNQWGIKGYSKADYEWTERALKMPNGCLDQTNFCYEAYRAQLPTLRPTCAQANYMCANNIEGSLYSWSTRGATDIRAHGANATSPIPLVSDYLNSSPIQQELGVNLNWTFYSQDVRWAFGQSGDLEYPDATDDLVWLLDQGYSVTLYYGDADYTCNWFGGEALSKEIKYKYHNDFNKAGYTPLLVDGVRYGDTRQYGNFSFTRVFRAGHQVSYYQPEAGFAIYNRSLLNFDIATGTQKITPKYGTKGKKESTYAEGSS